MQTVHKVSVAVHQGQMVLSQLLLLLCDKAKT